MPIKKKRSTPSKTKARPAGRKAKPLKRVTTALKNTLAYKLARKRIGAGRLTDSDIKEAKKSILHKKKTAKRTLSAKRSRSRKK